MQLFKCPILKTKRFYFKFFEGHLLRISERFHHAGLRCFAIVKQTQNVSALFASLECVKRYIFIFQNQRGFLFSAIPVREYVQTIRLLRKIQGFCVQRLHVVHCKSKRKGMSALFDIRNKTIIVHQRSIPNRMRRIRRAV